MQVEVIQFYMPDGHTKTHFVEVQDDLLERYESLRKCGCRLTAEVLTTGEVSQCIEHEEGDYVCDICSREDAVGNLDKIIRGFHEHGLALWIKGMNDG